MITYEEFLATKAVSDAPSGFDINRKDLNSTLFEFQKDIDIWAIKRGRAAIFAGTGLGKTYMQVEWAKSILPKANSVLILAPLAVAAQTVNEAKKLDVEITLARSQADITGSGIYITNYQKLDKFTPEYFGGVVLDESSIIKHQDAKTRDVLIEAFARTPYRLACTATPAPNDFMELGNHAEFLGVMSMSEMLATFFVHDGGETQKWRLKGHAEEVFWKWMASWSVCVSKPSDLGYDDGAFNLPPLQYHEHIINTNGKPIDGMLFSLPASGLQETRAARKGSIEERCERAAELANGNKDQWLIWCDLNEESERCSKLIKDAVQVTGGDTDEHKESTMMGFAQGKVRVLVSKPSICGFGMNWQTCHNMAFVGVSHSFERFYQAVRRCWRFGQTKPVNVHVIISELEQAVLETVKRKEKDAGIMIEEMSKHMSELTKQAIKSTAREQVSYTRKTEKSDKWTMELGDCVEVSKGIEDNSIDYSIFSPPFSSLYTYSNSDRDMGNVRDDKEFFDHFRFLLTDLHRVILPGRLVSIHCMNLPTSKQNHGYIGIRDFRGEIIREMEGSGFIYHSEVTIWKDPVTAMQRTKALGLLYKQLKKDSAMSRQGIADYLCTFRKAGENPKPVTKKPDEFSCEMWQNYASPVWMDINPSKTLQRQSAREHKDERHIAPLQLEVIERAIRLWTNPHDLVWSPFGGIGSEGYVAVMNQRRYIGAELKESYWKQAVLNLKTAEAESKELF